MPDPLHRFLIVFSITVNHSVICQLFQQKPVVIPAAGKGLPVLYCYEIKFNLAVINHSFCVPDDFRVLFEG